MQINTVVVVVVVVIIIIIFIGSETAHIHADNDNTVIHPRTGQNRKLRLLLPLNKNQTKHTHIQHAKYATC